MLNQRIEAEAFGIANLWLGAPEVPGVYIVSDVRLYREGLISSLTQQSALNVLGAGSSADVLGRISALRPQALLLDLAAHNSFAISRRAQQIDPALRVVAFAVAEADENVLACAEAGISGYVTRDGSIEDLVTAVRCALRGELVCAPRIAALLFSRLASLSGRQPTMSVVALLTPREREIAALVTCNLRNKEIARQLRLGPATIKNHVHNILQKLNVQRRGEIARLACEPQWGTTAPGNANPGTSLSRS
jgi:two-component system, NarL family, nitrate/nitrite response regulator NarL